MIIWLNGPFGGGKTTVSRELLERLPNAILFDPEEVGYMLRHALSARVPVDDFQDWASWRRLVVATALDLARDQDADLVVPQSVLNPVYWAEIADGLRAGGERVEAFTLHTGANTLEQRIRADTVESGAVEWRLDHIPLYAAALPWLETATHRLDTTGRSPADVAQQVIARVA